MNRARVVSWRFSTWKPPSHIAEIHASTDASYQLIWLALSRVHACCGHECAFETPTWCWATIIPRLRLYLVCVCVCVRACVWVCEREREPECVYVCEWVCVWPCVCLSVIVCVCLCLSPCVCLSVCHRECVCVCWVIFRFEISFLCIVCHLKTVYFTTTFPILISDIPAFDTKFLVLCFVTKCCVFVRYPDIQHSVLHPTG